MWEFPFDAPLRQTNGERGVQDRPHPLSVRCTRDTVHADFTRAYVEGNAAKLGDTPGVKNVGQGIGELASRVIGNHRRFKSGCVDGHGDCGSEHIDSFHLLKGRQPPFYSTLCFDQLPDL
ncbi:hypothetical protein [Micromonospora chersina]|uniref:hypothetical protein n=1 Tax=Micromonospora chersina TaxID=47854 RepID=UPI0033E5A7A8